MTWRVVRQALGNADMRKRIFYVIAMLIVFRALAHVPIPLAEPTQLRQLLDNLFNSQDLFGFLDILSGGALSNFSIVLMGLAPYINASIIMQLLTKAVPRLETLNSEGEHGRKKINQYTRLLTLPLSIIQSIGFLLLIRQQAGGVTGLETFTQSTTIFQWVLMVGALTGGSMLLMWLGELMSEQGVGNGISLLIFAGIVSTLPGMMGLLIGTIAGADASLDVFGWFTLPLSGEGLIFAGGIIFVTALVTFWVVKLNEAQRVLTVSYAKRVRGNRAYVELIPFYL